MIPAMVAFALYDVNKEFLNYVNKTIIPMIVTGITSLFHIGWCYLFVYHLRWSVQGAALSSMISITTNLILVLIFTSS